MTTRRTDTLDLSARELKDITRDCAEALVDACRVALAVLNENLTLLEQLESVTHCIDDELLADEGHDARRAPSTGPDHRPCAVRYDNMITPEQCAELWARIHEENRDEKNHT